MKKILTILALALITNFTFAQKLNYGIKAGFNGGLINASPQINGAKMLPGYHIAAFTDITIKDNFFIQPSLFFNTKGTSIEHKDHHDDLKLSDLDLQLHAAYMYKSFFVSGGPVIGFSLAGEAHAHDSLGNETSQKLTFGSKPGEYNQLNYGLSINIGNTFKNGLFFYTGYLLDHLLSSWSRTFNSRMHIVREGSVD